jgi:hypothetical protein
MQKPPSIDGGFCHTGAKDAYSPVIRTFTQSGLSSGGS